MLIGSGSGYGLIGIGCVVWHQNVRYWDEIIVSAYIRNKINAVNAKGGLCNCDEDRGRGGVTNSGV